MRPDAKSQVTIRYSDRNVPEAIDTVVISTQHDDFADEKPMQDRITADMERDRFMTPVEAKEYGLVDQVIAKRP